MFKLALALCAFSSTVSAQDISIVTDIAPLAGIATAIGGAHVAVTQLIDPKQSAHHLTLRPSHARDVVEADLIFLTGPILLPGLFEKVVNLSNNDRILTAQNIFGTTTFPIREMDHHDHNHDDDHVDDALDPHMWLLPQNAVTWATEITQRLSALAPDKTEIFNANLETFVVDLSTITEPARHIDQSTTIAVSHDAFQYAFKMFGDPKVVTLSTALAIAPSAQRVAEIDKSIDITKPACIVIDQTEPTALAEQFAEKFDIAPVQLSPIAADEGSFGNQYLDLMASIVQGIDDCLSYQSPNSH